MQRAPFDYCERCVINNSVEDLVWTAYFLG